MLTYMRKKAQSWMIKVLFGIIIIVFIFFYGYGQKSRRGTVIAEVNGTKITDTLFTSEYQKAFQSLARLYQNIYKDQFDDAMIDRVALRQRVLNDLIDETLMVQEAEKLSLSLSPEELQAAVHSNPLFQVDGKFNQQRFMATLRANQVDVDEFEEMHRRQSLIGKLTDLISLGGAEVSDPEVLDAYTLENEKINFQFARFNPTAYEKSVTVNDQELEAYFSENSALFELPPKVQVQYLVFATDDYLKTIEVSPEEIRGEYEYNREEFRVPKSVMVSHILITVEEDSGEEGLEKARKKAEQILDEATEGEDFGALAKEHSKDRSSAEKGGSIGWVREDETAPEHIQVAFSLEKGEIGPLIESDDGFHIVKVTDIREERVKPLEEVEEKIRSELATAKSRQLAEDECEEAFFAVFETKNLESYANQKGKVLRTTALFARNENLKEAGENLEFNNHAFSHEEGEVPPPLDINGTCYLMKVIKHEGPRIPALGEVKEKVRKEVLMEKAREKAKSNAEELLAGITAGISLSQAASERGLKLEETGLFERGNPYVPKVGPIQLFGKDIFSLSLESPLLKKVVSAGSVFFVLELKEEQKIDMEAFESQKEALRKRLYAEKKGQLIRQWLDSLKKNSEIKILEKSLSL